MALTTSSGAPLLRPEEIHDLIIRPVTQESVALQVSSVVFTRSRDYRIPIITADPSAGWIAEGAEIGVSDPAVAEVIVSPTKVGGITKVSRELADDGDEDATARVGARLVNKIAASLDAAFFGTVAAPAPSGLPSLAGVSTATTPTGETSWVDLDVFAEAIADAELEGAAVTSFVANPTDALVLSQLKRETGSNEPLLQPDPTQPTRRSILGIPLLVSKEVALGTVWAVPSDRVVAVVRSDAQVEIDRSVFFTSEHAAVKATMRVGFGFPHPAAVVKISLATV